MDLIDLNRCRICLCNEKQMYSLYEPIKDIDSVSNIAEVLAFCCDLQISKSDKKPQNICGNCKELAKNSCKFKIKSKLTDIKLNYEMITATTKCKQEVTDDFIAEEEVVQLYDVLAEDHKDLVSNFHDERDILIKIENETDRGKKENDQTSEDNFCSKAGYSSENIADDDDDETEANCQIGSKQKIDEMYCKSSKMIWSESSDSEVDNYILPDIKDSTNKAVENSIPLKSKGRYEQAYKAYKEWCSITPTERSISTENVVLAYFMDLAKTKKPSTLWATYSMVKTTLNINENIDISKFSKLLTYLKKKHAGYAPKKSGVFSKNDIDMFLKYAPSEFLPEKVALIIGIAGACRSKELSTMKMNHLHFFEKKITVTIPNPKTYRTRKFKITNIEWIAIVRHYINLRINIQSDRLFMQLRDGKLINQPFGHNTITSFPKKIARYLNLKDPAMYNGRCFRRTAGGLLSKSGGEILQIKSLAKWKCKNEAEVYEGNPLNS